MISAANLLDRYSTWCCKEKSITEIDVWKFLRIHRDALTSDEKILETKIRMDSKDMREEGFYQPISFNQASKRIASIVIFKFNFKSPFRIHVVLNR